MRILVHHHFPSCARPVQRRWLAIQDLQVQENIVNILTVQIHAFYGKFPGCCDLARGLHSSLGCKSQVDDRLIVIFMDQGAAVEHGAGKRLILVHPQGIFDQPLLIFHGNDLDERRLGFFAVKKELRKNRAHLLKL